AAVATNPAGAGEADLSRAITPSATTASSLSDSIDARRANDSTVNSSRARTGPPGGPPPLLTDTGTDKEPAADPGEAPGPDEDTRTATSWSRTDTGPTPPSTLPHGGCFPPTTWKITRRPHTTNRTRQTTAPTPEGDNPPPGRTLWGPLTEATDELSLGHGQPAGESGELRWDGVLQHGHR